MRLAMARAALEAEKPTDRPDPPLSATGSETDVSVYVWGTNDHGALCIPTREYEPEPRRVLAMRSQFVRSVAAAPSLSVCATGSGAVMQWGGGTSGGLPQPVPGAPEDAAALATDGRHIYALTDEGHVFSWEIAHSVLGTIGVVSPTRLSIPVDIEQVKDP